MPDKDLSNYFYGDEATQFTYFRIPCQLITHPRFKHLSTDSKLLYGTDPEAGYMKRPRKPSGFYYLSHQTTDTDCGIITAVTVTPGDVHDSRPYLEQLEYVHKNVVPIQAAAADSAYDFPLAHRVLEELGIDFFTVPQPAHDRTKVELKRDAFTYDLRSPQDRQPL